MTRLPRLALPFLALAAAACSEAGDPLATCPPTVASFAAIPALVVEVTDSVTGVPRAAGATGWAVTGATTVALVAPPQDAANLPTLRAYGPPGRYTVLVTRQGYAPWAASDVRVEDAGCGPRTLTLRARLQPVHTTQ